MSVAEAFVTIRPDMRQFGPELQSGVESQTASSGVGGTLGTWSRRLGRTAGLAGGAALAGGLWGGAKRVLDTEEAEVTFRRMGLSDRNIEQLTADIDEALSGTTITNPEGFALAGRFLAQGFDEADIPGIVGTIADLAQVGNREFGEMADVLVVAAGQGRITADELNRMGDVPLGRVAEELGMSEAALRDMVSSGELTAEAFLNAFSAVEEFNGAAKDPTTRQAFTNLRTTLSRAFEAFLGPMLGEGKARDALEQIRVAVEKMIPAFELAGRIIGDYLLPAIGFLAEMISLRLGPAFEFIGDMVDRFETQTVPLFRAAWETMSGAVEAAMALIQSVIETVTNAVSGHWDTVWTNVSGFFMAIWDGLSGFIETVASFVGGVLTSMGEAVSGKFAEIVGWFRALPGRMVGALGNLRGILASAGRQIIQGLWNGLRERWDSVKSWFGSIGPTIQNLKGPMSYDRVMLKPAGQAIMGGLAEGMDDGWRDVQRTIVDRSRELSNTFQLSGGGSGGITVNGGISVGSSRDVDDLRFSLRKAALQGAY